MSTVFVVNTTRDDITDAARYGKVRYVNISYVFPDETSDDGRLPQDALDNMDRCADEFRPELDFLLIVGDHVQLIAFSAKLAIRYSYFNVLRYDRKEHAYYPVKIDGLAPALVP